MEIQAILSLIAGMIALAISLFLFRIYSQKHKLHHILWAVGMFLWAVSDILQFYALVASWNVPLYMIYFFSSIMLAGFLGAGTMLLVFPKLKLSVWYMWFNIVASIALIIAIVFAPLNLSALNTAVTGANPIIDSSAVNVIAAIVNILALITFAGGALYSFIRIRKLYALLIFFGAIIPAIGGSLATASMPWFLPFTDFVGIISLGIGFYLSFIQRPSDIKPKDKEITKKIKSQIMKSS